MRSSVNDKNKHNQLEGENYNDYNKVVRVAKQKQANIHLSRQPMKT